MIDAEDVAAYLARLGLEREPPSAGALFRINQAHAERVPYETLWIGLGNPLGIDPVASARRVAHGTEGGYCFHLNGALSELLASLGYRVRRHVGGVHGAEGPSAAEMTNHLVLTVSELASDDNPAGEWYVDCGLGDALHEPLPLRPGAYHQSPFELSLQATTEGVGDWHLTHDPTGGFVGMSWRSRPATMADFAARHQWLSTDPASPFVKIPTVQLRDATGVTVLRGCVLSRIGANAWKRDVESLAELRDALHDLFGMDLGDAERALPEFWERTRRAHEKWDAAGRP